MTANDSHDLTTDDLMAPPPQWLHPLQNFVQKILPAIQELEAKLRDTIDQLEEVVTTVQEREKQRAYEHLITPPHDHTHAHVSHTSTKPPRPARPYRRRTP